MIYPWYYNMSRFTDFKAVEIPNKKCSSFKTIDELVYYRQYEWSDMVITVPRWFETDFASLPWFLHAFFSPTDSRWILAGILHDYLWSNSITVKDYQDGNDIFFEAMVVCWTPKFIAIPFYLAVSVSKYFYFLKKTFEQFFYTHIIREIQLILKPMSPFIEALILKLSGFIPWFLGAVIYALLDWRPWRQSMITIFVGTIFAYYAWPLVSEYLNVTKESNIAAVWFAMWMSWLTLAKVFIDASKDPKKIKDYISFLSKK